MTSSNFRVVLCRIRLFTTLISKILWLGSVPPLKANRVLSCYFRKFDGASASRLCRLDWRSEVSDRVVRLKSGDLYGEDWTIVALILNKPILNIVQIQDALTTYWFSIFYDLTKTFEKLVFCLSQFWQKSVREYLWNFRGLHAYAFAYGMILKADFTQLFRFESNSSDFQNSLNSTNLLETIFRKESNYSTRIKVIFINESFFDKNWITN